MSEQYFRVGSMIFQFELKPISFLVYCYLKRCYNKTAGSFPSKKNIAKACGISHGSVDNALKELQDKQLITIESRYLDGRQLSNKYEFVDLKCAWRRWKGSEDLEAQEAEPLPL